MTRPRGSITRQAAQRLVISLGLFVFVVVISAVTLYRAAIEKAANERADDLRSFYAARLQQQEHDWELQTRDLRVRIEYSRLLEEPHEMAVKLQAFMTVQGSDRRFHYLLIEDRAGNPVFRFGHDAPEWLPGSVAAGSRYFTDREGTELYRCLEEPVWLGRQGLGRMRLFFRIDNALLARLAAPGIGLRVAHAGIPVASSLGTRDLAGFSSQEAEVRTVGWDGNDSDPVQLTIDAPVRVLFSPVELGVAASVIPILDGLVLWFTLGTWLMRQTRRINALEEAVRDSSVAATGRRALESKLQGASAGLQDEISAVAETLHRTMAERESAERRIVSLNEELQHHNRQLESLNGELESFIYSVSHDLRAPLRAIAGYSTIVAEDYGDRLDEAGQELLRRIGVNAENMGRRMDDLLHLSRISRQEMERQEVNLSAIVASVVSELRERSPERRVEVVIEDEMVAFGDERLMSVALSNLIGNAWKFTLGTPHPRIEIGSGEREGERLYWVRDNGAGFDAALAGRLFMPFERLHSDAEFEGTGLGLAIVERVIRRHGGRIWAEGEVDQGAVFWFTL